MFSTDDIVSVYQFIKETPEGPLRKMMVGGEMSENHFRILLKIVRACQDEEFVEAFQHETLPKLRLTPAEHVLRENIWPICKRKLQSVGLLTVKAQAA